MPKYVKNTFIKNGRVHGMELLVINYVPLKLIVKNFTFSGPGDMILFILASELITRGSQIVLYWSANLLLLVIILMLSCL